MLSDLDIWLVAHRDLADTVLADPVLGRLTRIRERLAAQGYKLKRLDVGKRSTRATVKSATLTAKSSYSTVEDFMKFEEARLGAMESA